MLSCVLIIVLTLNYCLGQQILNVYENYKISVIHFNDFHARFEETDEYGNTCKNLTQCIGGFSRLYAQIQNSLKENPDAVVLNAGDSFQGTIWYTFGKWNVTQEFMNRLPIDAEVLGNHEFDDGIAGVVPYINSLKHPIVACNIDDSLEPSFQGTYFKSKIVERRGLKIGIIGVIISTCDQISTTGKLKFNLESPSVNAEAERLFREEGVFTNIVLSHSGYNIDKKIAENASERISLIVGGHSHTFLYTGENSPGSDVVGGDYPTVVESKYGHKVLIVQASAYSRYLGNITLYLDEYGEILDYSGKPIYLNSDCPQDATINAQLQKWKQQVDVQGTKVIGSSLTLLSQGECYNSECTLGNFVTDAMVYAYTDYAAEGSWTEAALAMTNPGGLRANIDVGDITYNDMVVAQPFENTFDIGEISGKHLKELFEFTATSYDNGDFRFNLLQLSGFKIIYNLDRPVGQRVDSIKVRCQNCTVPLYESLQEDKTYKVIANSFMLKENGRYLILSENIKNKRIGPLDMNILIDYLTHRSPVFKEVESRIIFSP